MEAQNPVNDVVVSNTDVLGAMLLRAVCTGSFELVSSLLYAGANVHMEDTFGFGIMHYAARYASRDIVRMLARTGPYINKTDDSGMSPLFHAVKIRRSEVIECFLGLGADLQYDHLHLAMLTGDYETIEILLNHWTKSNKSVDALDVLLPEATKQRDPVMVEILLEYGARALAKDEAGLTALSIASAAGDRDIVQLLLGYGAVPDYQDKSGRTMLNEMVEYRHIAMVDSLYSKRW